MTEEELTSGAYMMCLMYGTDSAELPTWKVVKCNHAPPPREWHRALVINSAMYVFGGHTADGNENALYRLAPREA